MLFRSLTKPKLIWDTFVQEKKLANGLVDGFGLLACCTRYGISTMSEIKKKSWRDTIINNYPNYTAAEKAGILNYNKQDVIVNEKLFLAQLNKFEKVNKDFYGLFSQAVFHGRRSLRTILCCVRHPLRTGGRNTDSRSFSIGVLNVARSGITLNRISPSKGSGRNTCQSRMVVERQCVFT